MTLAFLAFIVGVMVGALAGAVVVLTAFGVQRKHEPTQQWQTDVTWEKHA